jgi:hypothetical protein
MKMQTVLDRSSVHFFQEACCNIFRKVFGFQPIALATTSLRCAASSRRLRRSTGGSDSSQQTQANNEAAREKASSRGSSGGLRGAEHRENSSHHSAFALPFRGQLFITGNLLSPSN